MPRQTTIKKVLVIGSGPIVIGQAAEFDYAGTQACMALKEEGIEVVLLNSNPATIMTDPSIADKIYIEPLTVEVIEEIIKQEKPDGIIGTLGGQTGLNLAVQLEEQGILAKYHVSLLGTSVASIKKGEDRELFRELLLTINEPIPASSIVHSISEGLHFAQEIGYPVIIRPAYTLGGAGGGFAYNDEELESVLNRGLEESPIHQVLIEKSIKGWKEIEYEVMRDANDTCIIVCNMENFDPVGVHTGDSIVVAPSQTLTDTQYQMLRDASLKVIRELEVIGGCNIQFALDPHSDQYYIIEVNPRVSRSSALASKATGYPIARMAAKCAIGYHLDELINPITGNTFASYEPALDYIVVKLPRFPFDKFSEADRHLGTQMKATGEVMAIDRTFIGALNKALRSLEFKASGLAIDQFRNCTVETLTQHLIEATDLRLFAIAEAMRKGLTVQNIHMYTQIDTWFLYQIEAAIMLEQELMRFTWTELPHSLFLKAKKKNMSDQYLATLFNITETEVRQKRIALGLKPGYKLVDTCAAEFDAVTPYYYSTWDGKDEVVVQKSHKVLVIGSGPIRIGQGIEFDYCSVHAALALKKLNVQAIVMNNNPETVSTDYSIGDQLYFEPLTVEDILHVIEKEQIDGVLVQFGGQTAINVARELEQAGVKILGTSVDSIEKLEDREQFYQLLQSLDIPHITGDIVHNGTQLEAVIDQLGFPVLVRPSFVIGGQSMHIFYNASDLQRYLKQLEEQNDQRLWPLLVDQYVPGTECEMDIITDGQDVLVPGIFEHIEKAGVHSGDSITIFPPITISPEIKETLVDYAKRIAKATQVVGMMNIQFVITDQHVYVLEVNPRSSRTVPIMSKIMAIPMVECAVRVQQGEALKELGYGINLMQEPPYYAVKAPIFSASKLKDVDHVLGPEMKSTGEVLGLGETVGEAFAKSILNHKQKLLSPTQIDQKPFILCALSNRDKAASLPILKQLIKKGYKLLATPATAQFLRANQVEVEELEKSLFSITQRLAQQDLSAIINTPNQGRNKASLGFYLRQQATKYQIPCFTALDTVGAIINMSSNQALNFNPLHFYHNLKSESQNKKECLHAKLN